MYEIVLSIVLIIFIIYGKKYYDRIDYINAFKNENIHLEEHFFKSIDILNYSSKRKLWVHIPSGSDTDNYILLCIKSIIDHCGQDYNVVLFNDADLGKLLTTDNSMDNLTHTNRSILLLALLYDYGGVLMPRHTYLSSSFKPLDSSNKFYVSKIYNQRKSVSMSDYIYSTDMMGSNKNNPILLDYINKIKKETNLVFNDELLKTMDIPFIDPKLIGCQDVNDNKITLEDLMMDKHIELVSNSVGILIPHDEILKRHKYNWFYELNSEDVLTTHIFLSKYMMINK